MSSQARPDRPGRLPLTFYRDVAGCRRSNYSMRGHTYRMRRHTGVSV
jgi:hypothetical protein